MRSPANTDRTVQCAPTADAARRSWPPTCRCVPAAETRWPCRTVSDTAPSGCSGRAWGTDGAECGRQSWSPPEMGWRANPRDRSSCPVGRRPSRGFRWRAVYKCAYELLYS